MTTDEQEATEADIREVHTSASAATKTIGQALGRKADTVDVWKIAAVVALVVGLFAVALAVMISSFATSSIVAERGARLAQQEKTDAENQRTREAIGSLQLANEELRRRGQEPVTTPPEPTSPEAMVAAVTARVLTSLPEGRPPSVAEIQSAMVAHFAQNPVTVSPQQVATQVAAYLQANPPEPGPTGAPGVDGQPGADGAPGRDGPPGQPGETPTAGQIMDAFNAAAAENPSLLCAGKGTFTLVKGFISTPGQNVPREQAFWTCIPPDGTPPTGQN